MYNLWSEVVSFSSQQVLLPDYCFKDVVIMTTGYTTLP